MCSCATKETCKCDMKEGSFCKQLYRTEKAYFLVHDDTQMPTRMPYYPRPPHYKPAPHKYPPYKYQYFTPPPQTMPPTPPSTPPTAPPPPPPPSNGGYGMYPPMGGQSGGNIYKIPMPKKRNMMLDYLIGGGGDNSMAMMSPSMGLISQLMKGKGDGAKDNNIFKYLMMSQLMNKQSYYPQNHYPHHPHYPPPHSPPTTPPPPPPPLTTAEPMTEATTEPVPELGSYFDPKILMYMMSKNGGYDSKALFQILPYLSGKGLKLESLFVKVS